ncbi:GTP cyclohydrolase II RibA [Knoellia aerolata]|uniref:GTP cyclohydrolase II RibA n=1 Tax=Knoellia aerolata TaxID=442954 RepID=UPI00068E2187|nr:GTP cyclohydrolase II RibA [Knoellia aerolata]
MGLSVGGRPVRAAALSFSGLDDDADHFALGLGPWRRELDRSRGPGGSLMVRLHSECLTGDVFRSDRCDCGAQLQEALERLVDRGGLLLYLRQEGRGIGLAAKLDAYALQDSGLDTFAANEALGYAPDARDYLVAAQMLRALRVGGVSLLTNNPDKGAQLAQYGIQIDGMVPTATHLTDRNEAYLRSKAEVCGHHLFV